MPSHFLKIGALAISLLAPLSAHAQGLVSGAANGADQGNAAAGPVGAVVGAAAGAVTGTVDGILGIDQRPRFRDYVVREHRPSYVYQDSLQTGVILPQDGVTYYDVPPEYGATRYRYTVVNNRTVLVDPNSRAVIQIIE